MFDDFDTQVQWEEVHFFSSYEEYKEYYGEIYEGEYNYETCC